jgi:hypothetical protein
VAVVRYNCDGQIKEHEIGGVNIMNGKDGKLMEESTWKTWK